MWWGAGGANDSWHQLQLLRACHWLSRSHVAWARTACASGIHPAGSSRSPRSRTGPEEGPARAFPHLVEPAGVVRRLGVDQPGLRAPGRARSTKPAAGHTAPEVPAARKTRRPSAPAIEELVHRARCAGSSASPNQTTAGRSGPRHRSQRGTSSSGYAVSSGVSGRSHSRAAGAEQSAVDLDQPLAARHGGGGRPRSGSPGGTARPSAARSRPGRGARVGPGGQRRLAPLGVEAPHQCRVARNPSGEARRSKGASATVRPCPGRWAARSRRNARPGEDQERRPSAPNPLTSLVTGAFSSSVSETGTRSRLAAFCGSKRRSRKASRSGPRRAPPREIAHRLAQPLQGEREHREDAPTVRMVCAHHAVGGSGLSQALRSKCSAAASARRCPGALPRRSRSPVERRQLVGRHQRVADQDQLVVRAAVGEEVGDRHRVVEALGLVDAAVDAVVEVVGAQLLEVRRALRRAEELRHELRVRVHRAAHVHHQDARACSGRRGGRVTTSSSPAFFAVASMVPSMSSSSVGALAREGAQLAQRDLDLAHVERRGRCGRAGTCARRRSSSRRRARRPAPPDADALAGSRRRGRRATCPPVPIQRLPPSWRSFCSLQALLEQRLEHLLEVERLERVALLRRELAHAASGPRSHSSSSSAIFCASTSTPRKWASEGLRRSRRGAPRCGRRARGPRGRSRRASCRADPTASARASATASCAPTGTLRGRSS